MNLTTKNLTNINKVASEVHRKYVAGTHVGEEFDELIYNIMKELSKADVGHYYINVMSNWYLK